MYGGVLESAETIRVRSLFVSVEAGAASAVAVAVWVNL